MDIHAPFVKYISYPLIKRRDGFKGLYRHVREYERTQWLSYDEIRGLQLERLRSLIRHAYTHTTYYRTIMDEIGMSPGDVHELSDFEHLPALNKSIIRERFDEFVASNLSKDDIHFSETGGTSGIKMRFCRDNTCLVPKAASTLRHERWTGWDIGQSRGLVWPAEQDYVGYYTWRARLRNWLTNRESVLPAAVLNNEKISAYLAEIKRQRPVLIRGFTVPLHCLAQYVLRTGNDSHHVPSILSTGEPLYPHQRRIIEEAFHAEVFDAYMTREVGLIAQECSEHQGMHINAESLFVETVEHEHAGQNRVLVTDLLNFGMPFIRYEIGDTASLSKGTCPCGRGLPLMKMGLGRVGDVTFAPNGDVIASGALVLYLVDNGPPVGQVQIVQDSLHHLLIRITKDPCPGEELFNHYRKEIARLFGEKMQTSFELVDAIANEPSGKYRFAICTIPEHERPANRQPRADNGAANCRDAV